MRLSGTIAIRASMLQETSAGYTIDYMPAPMLNIQDVAPPTYRWRIAAPSRARRDRSLRGSLSVVRLRPLASADLGSYPTEVRRGQALAMTGLINPADGLSGVAGPRCIKSNQG